MRVVADLSKTSTRLAVGVIGVFTAGSILGCREDVVEPRVILPAVPSSLTVTPSAIVIVNGETVQLHANVRDSSGVTIEHTVVEWSTFDSSVAAVSTDGLVRGIRLGSVNIRAAVGEYADTAVVSVRVAFRTVSSGAEHSCGVTTNEVAYCWGDGGVGRIGDGRARDSPRPAAVSGRPFQQIDAGLEFTCALTQQGKAYCWGGNRSGQLGSGRKPDSYEPVVVWGDLAFGTVSASAIHACGLGFDGQAYCWGGNWFGEVGHGLPGAIYNPVPVVGSRSFATLATGFFFTCAIVGGVRDFGDAYCWGENQFGQLGVATTGESCRTPFGKEVPCATQPMKVSGDTRFVSLVAGARHACGLTGTGAAYCWGDNRFGQLGSRLGSGFEPAAVVGGSSFIQLTAGDSHTCGISDAGDAYCWGRNRSGELGSLATFENCDGQLCSTTPVRVDGGHRFRFLSAGGSEDGGHTCGITTESVTMCWGANASGQLGVGWTGGNSTSPVSVAGQLVNDDG